MKSILLTGATGFLGSKLLEDFLAKGYKVVVLKRSISPTYRIDHLLDAVKCFNVDQIPMSEVFEDSEIDMVVHTACSYGRRGEKAADLVRTNVGFGLELVECAIANGIKTFINTDSILPKDVNPYGLSKAHFREWLIRFADQIQVINFRIEHMYGPGDDTRKFVPWLIKKMLSDDQDIELTSGLQKRDFIYIDDVVSAYELVINKLTQIDSWSEFDLASGTLTTVKDFVSELADKIETSKSISILPRLLFGLVPYRQNEMMEPLINNSELIDLGWYPKVSVSEGIKRVIEQY